MGHRKQRKRARKQANRWNDEPLFFPAPSVGWEEDPPAAPWDWRDAIDGPALAAAGACGACREFVEDHESGRGTCLHPGSGVLSPWSDTPACPFFQAIRFQRTRG